VLDDVSLRDVRVVAVLAERDIGLQCECRDGVLTGILPSVWDGAGA
jgi:hypothetical protein